MRHKTNTSAAKNVVKGLVYGLIVGIVLLAVAYMLQYLGVLTGGASGEASNPLHSIASWLIDNLRASLIAFSLVLLMFLFMAERLRAELLSGVSIERISQTEYLADLCTSLFFGIGVIWTAIGMRSALLAGLGNLDSAVAAEVGAFAILQRLVDGGILLALSTTIVGGVGGYLMRVYKSLRTGALLRQRYADDARIGEQAVLGHLQAIESHMQSMLEELRASGNSAHPLTKEQ